MHDFDRAYRLASDLAGARVDPNEAQKTLAYLRNKKDSKAFFAYLRAVNKDGRAVIRSRQTLDYYRVLLEACERHLHGVEADEMAQTLEWAIRLLRYYRAAPEYHPEVTSAEPPPLRAAQSTEVPKPKLSLPEIADVFTGKVLDVDDTAVIIEVPGFNIEATIGVMRAEVLGGRVYRAGNSARVEVTSVRTLKNGRIVVDLKPAPRKVDTV